MLRRLNYVAQLKGSILSKMGSIICTFLAMPVMIRYLGPEQFGIWSTMLMLINWVMLFDIGIGNGLRNKVTECLAVNDTISAAGYVSTAFVVVGAVSVFLFFCFFIISDFIPWLAFFNTDSVSVLVLRDAVVLFCLFVFLNFWLSLVGQIFHGLQKSAFVILGQFISNAIALVFVTSLYFFTKSSLIYLVISYGVALVTSNMLLWLFLYRNHRYLTPIWKFFDISKIRSLLSIGLRFFLIQVAVIVIFMTDKIIITQLLGPEEVTPYDVVFKLFSIVTVVHSLVLIPVWSAYSDAYARNELAWIKEAIYKQMLFAIILIFVAFILALIGPIIVKIWIGDQIDINISLYYCFFFYIVVSVWSNVFAFFVNSINKLNVQLFTSVVAALTNIPLSIFFASYLELGLNGIVLATTCCLSIYAILGPFHVVKILKFRPEV
jgi:O-antigen/teichoic acid export membrane protein